MLVIGLTGSIGSGKTTVSELFSQKNIPIVNADKIARELLNIDTPAYHQVVLHFGKHIVNNDKHLNRARLRQVIFANQNEKLWLEQLLHPQIKRTINDEITKLEHSLTTPPYCIIEIPLLKDKSNYPMLDRILLIDCTQEIQLARVKQRDNCDEELIKTIAASHPAIEYRRQHADDIIENNGTLEQLKQKVDIQASIYRQQTSNCTK